MNEVASNSPNRIAGSDTREAASTATVRLVAGAAFLLGIPGWAAAFASTSAWKSIFSLAEWATLPLTSALIGSGLLAGIVAWKQGEVSPRPAKVSLENLPHASMPVIVLISLSVIVVGSGSERFAAAALGSLPSVVGWFVGRAARVASAACVTSVTPAAAGIVVAGVLTGALAAGPLAATTASNGFARGAMWTLALAVLATVNLTRAQAHLADDRLKAQTQSSFSTNEQGEPAVAFRCRDVAVWFGPNPVLQGAQVQADRGEVVALVGANGCGKTTLLRVAAGFVECKRGYVSIDGRDMTMLKPEERVELGLAFVSGARPIFPDLSVLENLRVSAYNAHLPARSFAAATEAVFDAVPALTSRRKDKAGVLSGGEQRILAVAQTLYMKPIALLADELSLGLDLDSRIAVLDLLRHMADEGVAVIAVDHDLASLLPRSDRALLMSEGQLKEFDDPMSILENRSDLLPATFLAEVPQ